MTALGEFALARFEAERVDAIEEAWGEHLARADEIAGQWWQMSDALIDAWFWFDRPLAGGRLVVDTLLASPHGLTGGERTWLSRMRESCMRLYEIVDVRPGVSIRLRDVLGDTQVTVRERTLSRSARRGQIIAARVIRAGTSGRPEIDLSVVDIPMLATEFASRTSLPSPSRNVPSETGSARSLSTHSQLLASSSRSRSEGTVEITG